MTKVLVLYYSSYGHIETMAYAVAEGARATAATVDVKRVAENVPEAIAKASYQARRSDRDAERAGELRRRRRRGADPIWQDAVGNGELLGTGGRSVDEWRNDRQGRGRVHVERDATRRK